MNTAYLIAWLAPLVTGALTYLAFSPVRSAGWRSASLGYGFALGALFVAVLTSIAARADTTHAWLYAAPWLLPIVIIAVVVGAKRVKQTDDFRVRTDDEAVARARMAWWKLTALIVLLASLVLRAAIAAREIWLRPLYPWDAWAAWMVKAKTWFLLGHYVPYVAVDDWLRQADANLYTGVAWHYPNALAWIEVWFASAAGGWIESLIDFAWLGIWAALLLGHYGQWRALGLGRARALCFIYVLGSLPLLTVHAALAGYADIWLATVFAFGVLAWMRWLQQRDGAQLLLALICAIALPTLKLEGLVWMACLLAAIGFGALSLRWRWRVVIFAVAMFLLLFVFGGLNWIFGMFGWIDANGVVTQPMLVPLSLVMHPSWQGIAADGIARTLLAQPNWHLLWWLAPIVIVWRWRDLIAEEYLRLPALLLAVCFGLLLYLFLATDASRWAQSFTAINRLVLQLTPASITLIALLLRDARFTAATDIDASDRKRYRDIA